MNSYVGNRTIQSAGNDVYQPLSPYQRAQTTGTATDKSSLIWKDFLSGVKKRKLLIKRLHDAALDSATSIPMLKKTLLELRQMTLTVIEDALEIEYRSRIDSTRTPKGTVRNARLPPITSYRAMEDKEDIFSLADMINDVDDLFSIPNIRVMLPMSFPSSRNPFMLAKTVDDMAVIVPPHPDGGNAEEELKVLELLRYKRASRALLRAETQVINRLPINLHELESVLHRMTDDMNVEKLIRCVCTLLDNEHSTDTSEANLNCLLRPVFNIEAHELLARLNMFKGARAMRIDVQVAVRQTMREYHLDHLAGPNADPATRYLVDWLDLVMSATKADDSQDMSMSFMPGGAGERSLSFNNNNSSILAGRGSAPPSRFGRGPSLGTISEAPVSGGTSGLIPMPLTSAALQLVQQRPLTSVSIPPNSASSSRGGLGTASSQRRSMQQQQQPVIEDDLVSEVDSKTGYVNTHEDIYIEPKPILKMQPRRMLSSLVDVISSAEGVTGQRPGSAQGIRQTTMTMKRSLTVPALTSNSDAQTSNQVHSGNVKKQLKNAKRRRNTQGSENGEDDDNEEDGDTAAHTATHTHDGNAKDQTEGGGVPSLLRRKIRSEVERVMHDLSQQSNNGANSENGISNQETLSSVRYELNRLQQELIRRQVLDPRHYHAMSVDAISHARQGLTVGDINAFDPLEDNQRRLHKLANNDLQSPVFIAEKVFVLHLRNGELEVTVTINSLNWERKLQVLITTPIQEAFRHGLIKDMPVLNQFNQHTLTLLSSTTVSELIFSRLTTHSFDEFVETKKAGEKVKLLQNIFETIEQNMLRVNNPEVNEVLMSSGRFLYFITNREVWAMQKSEDHVLVDITVLRHEMCVGSIIRITPILGLYNPKDTQQQIGPVIIQLSDHELEVLLLSDHGLFIRGMKHWSVMTVIAQWLCTRLTVKKVPALNLPTATSNNNTLTAKGLLWLENGKLDVSNTIKEGSEEEEQQEKHSEITDEDNYNLTNTYKNTVAFSTLMLLDVSLDRSIDVSLELLDMWKAMYTPRILGLTVSLYAKQDLEVLVITIIVTVPSRFMYKQYLKDLKKAEKVNEDDQPKEDDLLDFLDFDDFDNDDDNAEDTKGTKLEFTYRLTRDECLVFGYHPLVVDNKQLTIAHTQPTNKPGKHSKKKADNNKQSNGLANPLNDHPANVLWNILSRLTLSFLGNKTDPYETNASALDNKNWQIDFNRLLIRDVKTVSNKSLLMTVFVVGSELQIEAETVSEHHHHNKESKSQKLTKTINANEIRAFVLEEGHPLSLLEYNRRKDLAVKLLDFLKLISQDTQHQKLELQSYIETKIISIVCLATESMEEELGSLEINSAMTLSDLRILIKHELDVDSVPTQYRFLYKGVECSLRQEAFRRPWEQVVSEVTTGIIYIIPKTIISREFGTETDDIMKRRLLLIHTNKSAVAANSVANNSNFPRFANAKQRRIISHIKMTVIPIPTLCTVSEGKNQVFLLHSVMELLVAGDVIRLGHVSGRDYIVMSVGARVNPQSQQLQIENGEANNGQENNNNKSYPGGTFSDTSTNHDGDLNLQVIEIEPNYDLLSEPDFNAPIMGNFPYPTRYSGMYLNDEMKRVRILKRPNEMGFDYNFAGQKQSLVLASSDTQQGMVTQSQTLQSQQQELSEDEQSISSQVSLISDRKDKSLTPSKDRPKNRTNKHGKKIKSKVGNRTFTGVWIWKVIPLSQDTRPKWRQMYDDGLITYDYEYQTSSESVTLFRVQALFSYIEVLCTDSRIPELTYHAQRVHEMKVLPIDYYIDLIFTQMTTVWTPEYKKGIDRTKFIKLLRDTPTFPDLKVKPARVAQLDMLFAKVAKSPEFGLVGKYVSYQGFVHLLKLLALIRYPYKAKEGGEGEKKDGKPEEKVTHNKSNNKSNNTSSSKKKEKKAAVEQEFSDDLSSLDGSETSLSHSHSNSHAPSHAVSHHSESKSHAHSDKKSTAQHSSHNPLKQALTHGHGSNKHNHNDDNNSIKEDPLSKVDLSHLTYAYHKLITDHLMLYPNWYDTPWQHCKRLAMQKEALRYCAQTRIASAFRTFRQRKLYLFCVAQITIFQALIRRKIAKKKVVSLLELWQEDWYFRYRYYFATQVTKIVRRFLKRCWYERTLTSIRRSQVLLLKARRQKLKKVKDSHKKTKIFSEAKRINGVMVISRVLRKDPRNYTKDFGIWLEIFVPQSQQTFTFLITDEELRLYMSVALEVDIEAKGISSLSVHELLDKRNIKVMLAQRLIVHKASKKSALPLITFSKHALGQRGELRMTRGWIIQNSRYAPSENSNLMKVLPGTTTYKPTSKSNKSNNSFIIKLFETVEDVSIQLHHSLTCKVFTLTMSQHELREWIHEEHALTLKNDHLAKEKLQRLQLTQAKLTKSASQASLSLSLSSFASTNKHGKKAKVEVVDDTPKVEEILLTSNEVIDEGPSILHPKKKLEFYHWILSHVTIDTRHGMFKVVWSNAYEKSRKKESIIKIQSIWRRALVRPILVHKLDSFMLKVKTWTFDSTFYYLNTMTGVSQWDKPRLLGPQDLPTAPQRKWVPVTYYDEHTATWSVYYVNPFTGKYTSLVPEQAAKIMQKIARKYLLKPLRMPKASFLLAAKIIQHAEKEYKQTMNMRKLKPVINFALFLHLYRLEEKDAKDIYREAVDLSESNPLVTRAYAFFLLSTCEAPLQLNRDRALILLADAKRKDPTNSKFSTAHALFQLGVLRHPQDHRALVNLAIVQSMMYGNNYNAEKLLRRALALAPFEQRVMEIWNYLKDNFPERQLLYNPLSRVNNKALRSKQGTPIEERKVIHGRPVLQDSSWAGWVFVEVDKYHVSKRYKNEPYWYNPADGTEQVEQPDWKAQWAIRKERSYFEGESYNLEQYYDPLTAEYFQYHGISESYQ